MHLINTNKLAEETWSSPKGKFVGAGKEISEALGRKPQSTDLNERHPFDVEICRIPPGKSPYPYHLHEYLTTAQKELVLRDLAVVS